MAGQYLLKAIFLLRQLKENLRDKKKGLHIPFFFFFFNIYRMPIKLPKQLIGQTLGEEKCINYTRHVRG